ncbi:MAG: glutamine-hydrolyzing carbamoyl-phosphate synthase small subunit [Phycisphaerae bacterium]
MIAKLALEDGSVFTGTSFGATGTRTGEVVFNTALTGYQEVLTDPSYCGQIVTLTFPLIGNYGVNPDDFESDRPHLSGFVVKELPRRPSNYRSTAALPDFLAETGVIGLAGIDTRSLTRRIRIHGALRGVISTEIHNDIELIKLATESPHMTGANLVKKVAAPEFGSWTEPLWSFTPRAEQALEPDCHLVVIDCGIKQNILRHLVARGCTVSVVPGGAPAAQIRALRPDGVIVSNGPGDPAAVTQTIATLRELLGQFPILGICLGHQMLALALGAETYKLRFGHHGVNVPVLNRPANRVEVTSQNHGFAVSTASLEKAGGLATHINLNDDSLEGFVHPDARVLALQFHPEASPGPHDAEHLFHRYVEAVRSKCPIHCDWLNASQWSADGSAQSIDRA